MILKPIAIILGLYVAFLGAAVLVFHQTGVLVVDVEQKKSDSRFYVPVPMLLADMAIAFVPDDELHKVRTELGPHRELILKAFEELAKCPDGNFVEVETSKEKVLIAKKKGDLVIDVDCPTEKVHVSIPLRATNRLLAKLTND